METMSCTNSGNEATAGNVASAWREARQRVRAGHLISETNDFKHALAHDDDLNSPGKTLF